MPKTKPETKPETKSGTKSILRSRGRIYGLTALALASSLAGPAFAANAGPKPATGFDFKNPKLTAVDITHEAVKPLTPSPAWHLLKTTNGFRLLAADCKTLQTLQHDLVSWKALSRDVPTATAGSAAAAVPQASVQKGGFCVADVTSLLSDTTVSILDHHPFFDGPSAWTAVLFDRGFINTPRVVDDSEFTLLMNSPVCHSIKTSDPLRTGDIGVIRTHLEGGIYRELSAFVRIGADLVFTRDGSSRDQPYALENLNSVMKTQALDRLPERCRDQDPGNNSGCPNELLYKRCDSLTGYLAAHPVPPAASALVALRADVLALEKRMQPFAAGVKVFSDQESADVLGQHGKLFDRLTNTSQALMKQVDPADAAWFTAGQIRSLLVALAIEISEIESLQGTQTSETVTYANEPWQAVKLSPALQPNGTGPVESYIDCSPLSLADSPVAGGTVSGAVKTPSPPVVRGICPPLAPTPAP